MKTCYACKHQLLCYLRHKISDATKDDYFIDIEKYTNILDAVGDACLKFEVKE